MPVVRRVSRPILTVAFAAFAAASALAFEGKIVDVRAATDVVRAVLELKGLFKPAHKQLIESGGTLYVRVEAELWEDRAAWDRLVGPMRATTFRVRRDRVARRLAVIDAAGTMTPYADYPDPLGVTVDVAPADRLQDDSRYYLHAVATVGATVARGSNDVSDVVFGSDEDASGLAAVGKFLFRTAQQISDYLQNVTADLTSRKMTGKQIRSTRP